MATLLATFSCSPELLQAIGCIAVESAYLERFLETALYRLTGLDREVAHVLVEGGGTMLGRKIEAFGEIGAARLKRREKRKAELARLVARLKAANSDRAIALHGTWTPEIRYDPGIIDGVEFGPARATKRGKVGGQDTTMRAEKAMGVAEEIHGAHRALHAFCRDCWPRRFPEPKLPVNLPPVPMAAV